MAEDIVPVELADFLLIVAEASEVPIDSILATDKLFIDSQAALIPHRKAINQQAALAEVATLLSAGIMRRQPAPRRNVVAAMMALDELLYVNGCQWISLDIAPELERRLIAVTEDALRLTELASWLDELITC